MKITKETLSYLARLSRLALHQKELTGFTEDLNNILDYMAQLNTLDLKKTEPTSHAIHLENVFRKDVVKPSLKPSDALSNAPESRKGFFKVPRIIE